MPGHRVAMENVLERTAQAVEKIEAEVTSEEEGTFVRRVVVSEAMEQLPRRRLLEYTVLAAAASQAEGRLAFVRQPLNFDPSSARVYQQVQRLDFALAFLSS